MIFDSAVFLYQYLFQKVLCLLDKLATGRWRLGLFTSNIATVVNFVSSRLTRPTSGVLDVSVNFQ